MIDQLVSEKGPSVLVELLRSSSGDDYLRQVVMQSTSETKCKFQDLPTLCQLERTLPFVPRNLHPNDRSWMEPEVAQMRLATWIEYLLKTPDGSKVPRKKLISDANGWIKKTINLAKKSTTSPSDSEILDQCLVE
jgi:hypothetical protein